MAIKGTKWQSTKGFNVNLYNENMCRVKRYKVKKLNCIKHLHIHDEMVDRTCRLQVLAMASDRCLVPLVALL